MCGIECCIRNSKKIKHRIAVPLRDEALQIIIHSFNRNIPLISNPDFNHYIKEVGKVAGFIQRGIKGGVGTDNFLKKAYLARYNLIIVSTLYKLDSFSKVVASFFAVPFVIPVDDHVGVVN